MSGYVYVIGPARGMMKIGMTINPRKRLVSLQTTSPVALEIHHLAETEDPRATEKLAHALLHKCRAHGEWFRVSVQRAIEAVRLAVERPNEAGAQGTRELRTAEQAEEFASARRASEEAAATAARLIGQHDAELEALKGTDPAAYAARLSEISRLTALWR